VEQAHPFANDFLRKDVTNITEFFSRKGMQVLSKTELYNFVTDKYLTSDKNNDSVASVDVLREKLEEAISASEAKREIFVDEQTEQQNDLNEAVFLQSYIPTTLGEIANPYKEMDRINAGQREAVFENAIHTMLGLKTVKPAVDEESPALISEPVHTEGVTDSEGNTAVEEKKSNVKTKKVSKVEIEGEEEGEDSGSGDEDDDSEEGSDDDDEEDGDDSYSDREEGDGKYRRQLPTRDDPESRAKEKEARREAKKLSKAARATKRTTKIPKHQKKRSIKAGKK
jgi:RIO kinase 1